MKKIFCILSILTIVSPAMADVDKTTVAASANYVDGAVNALTSQYDATTNPNGKIVVSGSGSHVSNVDTTTNSGKITITKTNEVKVPVGSSNNSTTANIWVE